jgi:MFS family permease
LRIVQRIADGARAAMGEPGCRSAIGLIALVALLASPFIALVPAMSAALHHGKSDPVFTAVLVTAQGVGAVIGALALPVLAERVGRLTMMRCALFLLPLLLVNYGLARSLWWSAIAFLFVGAGYILVLSGLNTVVQLRAPAEARGRILSIYMMGLGIIYPIGAVLQGWIADRTGVRAVTVWGAVVLLAGMASIAALRPGILNALGDPGGSVAAPDAPDTPAARSGELP